MPGSSFLDLVIRGGRLYDGTGDPFSYKDISIQDGMILEVGQSIAGRGRREIDARGLAVAPGFIDLHTHGDHTVLLCPDAENYISQGVTTAVCGNCGLSMFPLSGRYRDQTVAYLSPFINEAEKLSWNWETLDDFNQLVKRNGARLNLAHLVGHGSIRIAVMGFDNSTPTFEQASTMRELLKDAMDQGAFGMSTGLIYPPGSYSDTQELKFLASTLRTTGGIYTTHLRSEDDELMQAVAEALSIGKECGIAVQFSHHKALCRRNWGRVEDTLAMMRDSRSEGVDVSCDVYPYDASMTTISVFLPGFAMEGGMEEMLARIAGGFGRENILRTMSENGADENCIASDYPWSNILIAECPERPASAGRTLDDILRKNDRRQSMPEAFLDWMLEIKGNATHVALESMSEDDIRTIMKSPYSAVASDGWFYRPEGVGYAHPRSYGTFSRFLGRYVRDEGLMAMEEAIRKITSFPASRLGLKDRGQVAEGCCADITIFDQERVIDTADFLSPCKISDGLEYVIVNGQVAFEHGKITGDRHGQILSPCRSIRR
jgi:N-acyl-D-amino-acid deacylase